VILTRAFALFSHFWSFAHLLEQLVSKAVLSRLCVCNISTSSHDAPTTERPTKKTVRETPRTSRTSSLSLETRCACAVPASESKWAEWAACLAASCVGRRTLGAQSSELRDSSERAQSVGSELRAHLVRAL